MMPEQDELVALIEAEIGHHISPVIGWLRMDAVKGRVDTDQKRSKQYYERQRLAAEAIAEKVRGTGHE